MRRREFIAGLTGAAAWPLAARAQQPQVPIVGLLTGASFEGPYALPVAAIRQGLQETGFVEGRNLAIAYRTAAGRYDRLPELAADLVRSRAAAIIAIGASAPALAAAKAAALAVPMVFANGSDAVDVGLVQSPGRPEGDVAGTRVATAGPASRRLEMLLEMVQRRNPIGYLDNPRASETFETNVEYLTTTARNKERELVVFDAATEREIETAFFNMALWRIRALIVSPDPFLTTRQEQIIALAAESALPAIYAARGAVMLGGLMSYGMPANDIYRLAGIYAGRILNGATPADSPVALSTRFELVINRGTAKALRIAVPRPLQIRADAIID